MNTKDITREQISALADGELPDSQVANILVALRQDEARADWDVFHQIGDVLRSDDMAMNMSPGFAARMAARLDAEPTIFAPDAVASKSDGSLDRSASATRPRQAMRWAIPSMAAAAAMATVAFFTTPQLLVAMKGEDAASEAATIRVAAESNQAGAVLAPEGVVLRDPRIDDYLMAHQHYSPSVYYSTAHFARSAAFTIDSNK